MQCVEDSKAMEDEEEKGFVEVTDKLFGISVAKLDILCVTVRT